MEKANTLVAAMAAINALTPLVASLVSQLRQTGETDEQVIARAQAMVAETRQLTIEDMKPDA